MKLYSILLNYEKIVVIIVLGLFFATKSKAQLDASQLTRVNNVANTTEMNNLTPNEGCVVYVDSENTIYVYDGTQWVNAFSTNSDGWKMTGNSASSSNFTGTTNNEDFKIRTNNAQRMVVKNSGRVGIGTDNPGGRFEVVEVGTSGNEVNGTATSNSTGSSSHPPSHGNDNFDFSYWQSGIINFNWVNVWYKVELNQAEVVNRYSIRAYSNAGPTNWQFQGSNDDQNWTDLHTISNTFGWMYGSVAYSFQNTTSYKYYRWLMHRGPGWIGSIQVGEFNLFLADITTSFIVAENGNVGVGISPTQKLHVEGNVLASSYSTPDYVFEKYYKGKSKLNPSYEFMEIESVEEFVRKNKHLPGIPSAKAVEEKGGIIVNKSIEQNLEKIEELYLRLFELNATHEKLKLRLQELKKNNTIK